jgi:hypothetical protein
MRDWFLYAPHFALNEATRFYVDTVAAAGRLLGRELRHVTSARDLPDRADVLVIECKSAVKLRLRRPRARYWLWMQGIVPEEARLHFGSRAREMLWTGLERLALPAARGVLVVSTAMREHLERKYGLRGVTWFRMPCVNATFEPAAFSVPGRYDAPSFVYAGGLQAWQCVDLSLEVFRRVRRVHPDATLTLLTGDRRSASEAVASAGVDGVTIDFVPLEKLKDALQRFKYGFVLRRPHVVNAVATPTKLSSYMAVGVVPVTTTAVHDFAAVLRGVDPLVMSDSVDPDAIAAQVLAVEEKPLAAEAVLESYSAAFRTHFDHSAYLQGCSEFLRATGLKPSP